MLHLRRELLLQRKSVTGLSGWISYAYGRSRYHQAADEWSPNWDLRGQVEDLQVLYTVGSALANSREWPQWKEGSEFGPARVATADQRR